VVATRAEAVAHLRALSVDASPEVALASLDPAAVAFVQDELAVGGTLVGRGVGASPGVGTGRLVVDVDAALDAVDRGEAVVFAASSTSPADEPVLRLARAVITTSGGTASHAAVLARAFELPAVCGASALAVTEAGLVDVDGAVVVAAGDEVTVDGGHGQILVGGSGAVAVVDDDVVGVLGLLDAAAGVVLERHGVTVQANADTAEQAARAVALRAAAIGLCRTEHQLEGDGWRALGALLATPPGSPAEADLLAGLEPRWREATADLLAAAGGLPVTVRLLDAPVSEFVGAAPGAASGDASLGFGLRGVGQGLARPALVRAQARALAGAIEARTAVGATPDVRVLLPFVATVDEVVATLALVRADLPDVVVGVMVETPRAALVAGALAAHVDVFAIGSNDLTQLTFGRSRDDVAPGLADPFVTLDVDGVGRLVALAITAGRAAQPALLVSVCGEHASDPSSIAAYLAMGVTAFSVVPARLRATRLAAAHALLRSR